MIKKKHIFSSFDSDSIALKKQANLSFSKHFIPFDQILEEHEKAQTTGTLHQIFSGTGNYSVI
jgi:hypothetical protein